MRNRKEEIKAKGFNIIQGTNQTEKETPYISPEFAKIKIGAQTLEDAILTFGDLKKANPKLTDKDYILRAITSRDLVAMREISNFFYLNSGIYQRVLRYLAFMYRYDWFVTPYINDKSIKQEKLLKSFNDCLKLLDDFKIKEHFNDIALKVLINGAYYGYTIETNDSIALQELPPNYCRCKSFKMNKPVVEFNMRFFDVQFKDAEQRMRVLKLFPQEFSKGYVLYKQGKLPPQFQGDTAGWYLLDPDRTVKFNLTDDNPAFISMVPYIVDLNAAQDLDRKKSMQRLSKILVQKMPLDKNGELIFDVEEAQQLHNNAVQMVSKRAIGTDILTTFADVEIESLSDTNAASAQTDDLERVERQLFNEGGTPQNLFNTSGNLALEKSILNDASTMYPLLLQFENFLNQLISKFNTQPRKFEFKVQILTTTIYNYQDMAKLYKEQTQLGYSKMLPQIALGQTQRSVLANAYFENEILDLVNVFIPPLMSSTMNSEVLNRSKSVPGEEKKAGREELADDKKSEKTIANKESMS